MKFKFLNLDPTHFGNICASDLGLQQDDVVTLEALRVGGNITSLFFSEYPGTAFDSSLFEPSDKQDYDQLIQNSLGEPRFSTS